MLRENGGPEGSCTLNPPADNGALCCLSYESEMVGGAGNAPVRRFQLCLTPPDLQSGSRITSLRLVPGVGVSPTEDELYEARLNFILPGVVEPVGNAPT